MSPALRALSKARASVPPVAGAEATTPAARAELDQVYEQWADYVWRMLQRLGVRRADLEDLCHDVFLVAHRRFGEFDGRVGVNAWLFGICLRVAANYRRRARFRHEHVSTAIDDEAARMRAPVTDEPEQQLSRLQAQERVNSVLESMDLTKRAVFLMYEIEGVGCQQIAEQLGIPVGTVYSRLHAARGIFEKEAERFAATPELESEEGP